MTVASLGKALDLLQLFTPSRPEWSVKELSEVTGYPKGSISRMLATFVARGFLRQDPHTRRYRLGPAFLVATRLVHGHLDYGSLAEPVLQELAARTKETAIWMVRVGWRSLCQATVESPFPVRMAAEVGRYASLHSGASNKPILAFMDAGEITEYLDSPYFVSRGPRTIVDAQKLWAHLADIRQKGYAESDSEVEPDIQAFGAPVFDAGGAVLGAVSVAGPCTRMSTHNPDEVIASVQRAAQSLSWQLGWRGPWPAPWRPKGLGKEPISREGTRR
ncbi:MAG: IclR family transcriptional regulator [Bacillota bacterium]|nr:IclR family transcriptional regulator [Bacillota bacterium]